MPIVTSKFGFFNATTTLFKDSDTNAVVARKIDQNDPIEFPEFSDTNNTLSERNIKEKSQESKELQALNKTEKNSRTKRSTSKKIDDILEETVANRHVSILKKWSKYFINDFTKIKTIPINNGVVSVSRTEITSALEKFYEDNKPEFYSMEFNAEFRFIVGSVDIGAKVVKRFIDKLLFKPILRSFLIEANIADNNKLYIKNMDTFNRYVDTYVKNLIKSIKDVAVDYSISESFVGPKYNVENIELINLNHVKSKMRFYGREQSTFLKILDTAGFKQLSDKMVLRATVVDDSLASLRSKILSGFSTPEELANLLTFESVGDEISAADYRLMIKDYDDRLKKLKTIKSTTNIEQEYSNLSTKKSNLFSRIRKAQSDHDRQLQLVNKKFVSMNDIKKERIALAGSEDGNVVGEINELKYEQKNYEVDIYKLKDKLTSIDSSLKNIDVDQTDQIGDLFLAKDQVEDEIKDLNSKLIEVKRKLLERDNDFETLNAKFKVADSEYQQEYKKIEMTYDILESTQKDYQEVIDQFNNAKIKYDNFHDTLADMDASLSLRNRMEEDVRGYTLLTDAGVEIGDNQQRVIIMGTDDPSFANGKADYTNTRKIITMSQEQLASLESKAAFSSNDELHKSSFQLFSPDSSDGPVKIITADRNTVYAELDFKDKPLIKRTVGLKDNKDLYVIYSKIDYDATEKLRNKKDISAVTIDGETKTKLKITANSLPFSNILDDTDPGIVTLKQVRRLIPMYEDNVNGGRQIFENFVEKNIMKYRRGTLDTTNIEDKINNHYKKLKDKYNSKISEYDSEAIYEKARNDILKKVVADFSEEMGDNRFIDQTEVTKLIDASYEGGKATPIRAQKAIVGVLENVRPGFIYADVDSFSIFAGISREEAYKYVSLINKNIDDFNESIQQKINNIDQLDQKSLRLLLDNVSDTKKNINTILDESSANNSPFSRNLNNNLDILESSINRIIDHNDIWNHKEHLKVVDSVSIIENSHLKMTTIQEPNIMRRGVMNSSHDKSGSLAKLIYANILLDTASDIDSARSRFLIGLSLQEKDSIIRSIDKMINSPDERIVGSSGDIVDVFHKLFNTDFVEILQTVKNDRAGARAEYLENHYYRGDKSINNDAVDYAASKHPLDYKLKSTYINDKTMISKDKFFQRVVDDVYAYANQQNQWGYVDGQTQKNYILHYGEYHPSLSVKVLKNKALIVFINPMGENDYKMIEIPLSGLIPEDASQPDFKNVLKNNLMAFIQDDLTILEAKLSNMPDATPEILAVSNRNLISYNSIDFSDLNKIMNSRIPLMDGTINDISLSKISDIIDFAVKSKAIMPYMVNQAYSEFENIRKHQSLIYAADDYVNKVMRTIPSESVDSFIKKVIRLKNNRLEYYNQVEQPDSNQRMSQIISFDNAADNFNKLVFFAKTKDLSTRSLGVTDIDAIARTIGFMLGDIDVMENNFATLQTSRYKVAYVFDSAKLQQNLEGSGVVLHKFIDSGDNNLEARLLANKFGAEAFSKGKVKNLPAAILHTNDVATEDIISSFNSNYNKIRSLYVLGMSDLELYERSISLDPLLPRFSDTSLNDSLEQYKTAWKVQSEYDITANHETNSIVSKEILNKILTSTKSSELTEIETGGKKCYVRSEYNIYDGEGVKSYRFFGEDVISNTMNQDQFSQFMTKTLLNQDTSANLVTKIKMRTANVDALSDISVDFIAKTLANDGTTINPAFIATYDSVSLHPLSSDTASLPVIGKTSSKLSRFIKTSRATINSHYLSRTIAQNNLNTRQNMLGDSIKIAIGGLRKRLAVSVDDVDLSTHYVIMTDIQKDIQNDDGKAIAVSYKLINRETLDEGESRRIVILNKEKDFSLFDDVYSKNKKIIADYEHVTFSGKSRQTKLLSKIARSGTKMLTGIMAAGGAAMFIYGIVNLDKAHKNLNALKKLNPDDPSIAEMEMHLAIGDLMLTNAAINVVNFPLISSQFSQFITSVTAYTKLARFSAKATTKITTALQVLGVVADVGVIGYDSYNMHTALTRHNNNEDEYLDDIMDISIAQMAVSLSLSVVGFFVGIAVLAAIPGAQIVAFFLFVANIAMTFIFKSVMEQKIRESHYNRGADTYKKHELVKSQKVIEVIESLQKELFELITNNTDMSATLRLNGFFSKISKDTLSQKGGTLLPIKARNLHSLNILKLSTSFFGEEIGCPYSVHSDKEYGSQQKLKPLPHSLKENVSVWKDQDLNSTDVKTIYMNMVAHGIPIFDWIHEISIDTMNPPIPINKKCAVVKENRLRHYFVKDYSSFTIDKYAYVKRDNKIDQKLQSLNTHYKTKKGKAIISSVGRCHLIETNLNEPASRSKMCNERLCNAPNNAYTPQLNHISNEPASLWKSKKCPKEGFLFFPRVRRSEVCVFDSKTSRVYAMILKYHKLRMTGIAGLVANKEDMYGIYSESSALIKLSTLSELFLVGYTKESVRYNLSEARFILQGFSVSEDEPVSMGSIQYLRLQDNLIHDIVANGADIVIFPSNFMKIKFRQNQGERLDPSYFFVDLSTYSINQIQIDIKNKKIYFGINGYMDFYDIIKIKNDQFLLQLKDAQLLIVLTYQNFFCKVISITKRINTNNIQEALEKLTISVRKKSEGIVSIKSNRLNYSHSKTKINEKKGDIFIIQTDQTRDSFEGKLLRFDTNQPYDKSNPSIIENKDYIEGFIINHKEFIAKLIKEAEKLYQVNNRHDPTISNKIEIIIHDIKDIIKKENNVASLEAAYKKETIYPSIVAFGIPAEIVNIHKYHSKCKHGESASAYKNRIKDGHTFAAEIHPTGQSVNGENPYIFDIMKPGACNQPKTLEEIFPDNIKQQYKYSKNEEMLTALYEDDANWKLGFTARAIQASVVSYETLSDNYGTAIKHEFKNLPEIASYYVLFTAKKEDDVKNYYTVKNVLSQQIKISAPKTTETRHRREVVLDKKTTDHTDFDGMYFSTINESIPFDQLPSCYKENKGKIFYESKKKIIVWSDSELEFFVYSVSEQIGELFSLSSFEIEGQKISIDKDMLTCTVLSRESKTSQDVKIKCDLYNINSGEKLTLSTSLVFTKESIEEGIEESIEGIITSYKYDHDQDISLLRLLSKFNKNSDSDSDSEFKRNPYTLAKKYVVTKHKTVAGTTVAVQNHENEGSEYTIRIKDKHNDYIINEFDIVLKTDEYNNLSLNIVHLEKNKLILNNALLKSEGYYTSEIFIYNLDENKLKKALKNIIYIINYNATNDDEKTFVAIDINNIAYSIDANGLCIPNSYMIKMNQEPHLRVDGLRNALKKSQCANSNGEYQIDVIGLEAVDENDQRKLVSAVFQESKECGRIILFDGELNDDDYTILSETSCYSEFSDLLIHVNSKGIYRLKNIEDITYKIDLKSPTEITYALQKWGEAILPNAKIINNYSDNINYFYLVVNKKEDFKYYYTIDGRTASITLTELHYICNDADLIYDIDNLVQSLSKLIASNINNMTKHMELHRAPVISIALFDNNRNIISRYHYISGKSMFLYPDGHNVEAQDHIQVLPFTKKKLDENNKNMLTIFNKTKKTIFVMHTDNYSSMITKVDAFNTDIIKGVDRISRPNNNELFIIYGDMNKSWEKFYVFSGISEQLIMINKSSSKTGKDLFETEVFTIKEKLLRAFSRVSISSSRAELIFDNSLVGKIKHCEINQFIENNMHTMASGYNKKYSNEEYSEHMTLTLENEGDELGEFSFYTSVLNEQTEVLIYPLKVLDNILYVIEHSALLTEKEKEYYKITYDQISDSSLNYYLDNIKSASELSHQKKINPMDLMKIVGSILKYDIKTNALSQFNQKPYSIEIVRDIFANTLAIIDNELKYINSDTMTALFLTMRISLTRLGIQLQGFDLIGEMQKSKIMNEKVVGILNRHKKYKKGDLSDGILSKEENRLIKTIKDLIKTPNISYDWNKFCTLLLDDDNETKNNEIFNKYSSIFFESLHDAKSYVFHDDDQLPLEPSPAGNAWTNSMFHQIPSFFKKVAVSAKNQFLVYERYYSAESFLNIELPTDTKKATANSTDIFLHATDFTDDKPMPSVPTKLFQIPKKQTSEYTDNKDVFATFEAQLSRKTYCTNAARLNSAIQRYSNNPSLTMRQSVVEDPSNMFQCLQLEPTIKMSSTCHNQFSKIGQNDCSAEKVIVRRKLLKIMDGHRSELVEGIENHSINPLHPLTLGRAPLLSYLSEATKTTLSAGVKCNPNGDCVIQNSTIRDDEISSDEFEKTYFYPQSRQVPMQSDAVSFIHFLEHSTEFYNYFYHLIKNKKMIKIRELDDRSGIKRSYESDLSYEEVIYQWVDYLSAYSSTRHENLDKNIDKIKFQQLFIKNIMKSHLGIRTESLVNILSSNDNGDSVEAINKEIEQQLSEIWYETRNQIISKAVVNLDSMDIISSLNIESSSLSEKQRQQITSLAKYLIYNKPKIITEEIKSKIFLCAAGEMTNDNLSSLLSFCYSHQNTLFRLNNQKNSFDFFNDLPRFIQIKVVEHWHTLSAINDNNDSYGTLSVKFSKLAEKILEEDRDNNKALTTEALFDIINCYYNMTEYPIISIQCRLKIKEELQEYMVSDIDDNHIWLNKMMSFFPKVKQKSKSQLNIAGDLTQLKDVGSIPLWNKLFLYLPLLELLQWGLQEFLASDKYEAISKNRKKQFLEKFMQKISASKIMPLFNKEIAYIPYDQLLSHTLKKPIIQLSESGGKVCFKPVAAWKDELKSIYDAAILEGKKQSEIETLDQEELANGAFQRIFEDWCIKNNIEPYSSDLNIIHTRFFCETLGTALANHINDLLNQYKGDTQKTNEILMQISFAINPTFFAEKALGHIPSLINAMSVKLLPKITFELANLNYSQFFSETLLAQDFGKLQSSLNKELFNKSKHANVMSDFKSLPKQYNNNKISEEQWRSKLLLLFKLKRQPNISLPVMLDQIISSDINKKTELKELRQCQNQLYRKIAMAMDSEELTLFEPTCTSTAYNESTVSRIKLCCQKAQVAVDSLNELATQFKCNIIDETKSSMLQNLSVALMETDINTNDEQMEAFCRFWQLNKLIEIITEKIMLSEDDDKPFYEDCIYRSAAGLNIHSPTKDSSYLSAMTTNVEQRLFSLLREKFVIAKNGSLLRLKNGSSDVTDSYKISKMAVIVVEEIIGQVSDEWHYKSKLIEKNKEDQSSIITSAFNYVFKKPKSTSFLSRNVLEICKTLLPSDVQIDFQVLLRTYNMFNGRVLSSSFSYSLAEDIQIRVQKYEESMNKSFTLNKQEYTNALQDIVASTFSRLFFLEHIQKTQKPEDRSFFFLMGDDIEQKFSSKIGSIVRKFVTQVGDDFTLILTDDNEEYTKELSKCHKEITDELENDLSKSKKMELVWHKIVHNAQQVTGVSLLDFSFNTDLINFKSVFESAFESEESNRLIVRTSCNLISFFKVEKAIADIILPKEIDKNKLYSILVNFRDEMRDAVVKKMRVIFTNDTLLTYEQANKKIIEFINPLVDIYKNNLNNYLND